MKKTKKQKSVVSAVEPEDQPPLPQDQQPLAWETFFRCQPNPVLRSQLITALLAGVPLQVDRIPTPVLLDAVLLAFAARTYCEAEIVDDFQTLCDRAEEEWRQPDWTTKVFSQLHACAANFIINHGSKSFSGVEEQYIVPMVRWYLGHAAPDYEMKELTASPRGGVA